MRSWSHVGWRLVDEWDGGFGWMRDERLQRTSHALVVDGRVWLVDPVDEPELEARVRALGEPAGVLQLLDRHERGCPAWARRLGVRHRRLWEAATASEGIDDAPFRVLPVRSRRYWREVALWEPVHRTLVTADALGTIPFFRAPGERVGFHPLIRPWPPRALRRVEPQRILVGHGEGVSDRAAEALHDTLDHARRRLPGALRAAVSALRGGSAAST
jgi:hypothetical protein